MVKLSKISQRGILLLIVLLSSLFVYTVGRGSLCGHNAPDVNPGTVLFDSFTYQGNDDFYIENPLLGRGDFYNPILPGWYSDPSICTNGEDYFLVTSTFSYFPGVPIFHSTNLINWNQIGHVLDRPSQLINMEGQGVSGGIFAPAIEYNKANNTYYMVTTNVGAGNFFVKTQDPFGSWSDPIALPEVGGINPSFFFDDNGKAYIINSDVAPNYKPQYSGHRTIRIQEFDVATDKVVGPRKILVDKGAVPADNPIWIEGPHMYKIDGKYFLIAAEGGTSDRHSEVVFRGESPMGPFTAWDKNPILTQRSLHSERLNPVTCAGHADFIQTKQGDWWALFLACRPITNRFENLGRETFLMPVKWSSDGYPYITQGDEVIPQLFKYLGVERDSVTTFGNFKVVDSFDSPTLNKEWLTLRAPATQFYSLSDYPGYLALQCAPIKVSEKRTPAYVGRRMQHHKFECTTRMYFHFDVGSERAGMLLFKDESHYYYLSLTRQEGGYEISLTQPGVPDEFVLASSPLAEHSGWIDFKLLSSGVSYDFYYATQEGEWKNLIRNVDASLLSTAVAGGFTGTTVGMYATTSQ
ncbi:MAG: glycoside hydrolase family 43 protein [Phocaeicola sp.]